MSSNVITSIDIFKALNACLDSHIYVHTQSFNYCVKGNIVGLLKNIHIHVLKSHCYGPGYFYIAVLTIAFNGVGECESYWCLKKTHIPATAQIVMF